MAVHTSTSERRRHPRRKSVSVHLSAIVRTRDSIAEYVVEDLSAGGALLVGPSLDPDTIVEVALRNPGDLPVRVMGRVARAQSNSIGIAFLHQGDEAEDAIQSILLRQLERESTVHA